MGLNNLLGILSRYTGGAAGAPPPNVEQDYSQVAEQAPQPHVASGLAEAFRSSDTPPFSQMLSTLFSNSDGEQRAGILQKLLGTVGPSILASGGLNAFTGLLRDGQPSVTPEQANQISPQAVQQLAENAEKKDPSIVDQASEFYAQHPTLVKSLGVASLALIMSHMARR